MGNKKIKVNLNNVMQKVREDNSLTISKLSKLHKEFLDDKSLEGLAPRTLRDYKQHFKYFNQYVQYAYRTNIDRIVVDEKILKDYLKYMVNEKKYSPFTVNVRLRTLRTFFKWLKDQKYTKENFALKIKLMKVPMDSVTLLSDLEIKKLLNSCDLSTYAGFRDFSLIITILDCGIRIGEASQLKIDDINLSNKLIKVRAEIAKTREERQIPISHKTTKLLKELISIAKQMQCEYVFQSTYGGKIKENNLSLSLKRLGEKAGIKKRCTGYVFRHIFATNCVKNGMNLFSIQRIMGHTIVQTTRRYVQLDTTDLQKQHKKYNIIDKYLQEDRG
ncbi:tyrosine-type recombinase/integrase [Clostridium sp. JS66]|uniref:tyrosine-type recombinase/integrase n=1 Tax=Clostridium sp. JS66 TaxID=3064705 RepID=UPI00298ECF46|nr:tyrosine-type recombinase/integrase [Clostridium sp. JS66]WPC42913.1 tyrosine-type recombinase/integrase [Clostridium sp. JS66]